MKGAGLVGMVVGCTLLVASVFVVQNEVQAAAKRLKISLSTAWKLNQTYQIGFPERSWKKRRKGLIA